MQDKNNLLKVKVVEDKEKWYKSAWLRRIGVLGFLFFLIKGLIWLAFIFGLNEWLNS